MENKTNDYLAAALYLQNAKVNKVPLPKKRVLNYKEQYAQRKRWAIALVLFLAFYLGFGLAAYLRAFIVHK